VLSEANVVVFGRGRIPPHPHRAHGIALSIIEAVLF
jgi:hypothetical protein